MKKLKTYVEKIKKTCYIMVIKTDINKIVIRKAYGGAYIAMCSKHLQADYVFSWPGAEIAVMGLERALKYYIKSSKKDLTRRSERN